MGYLDGVLRKFFSNFTVKSTGRGKEQRCEITHKLNEPWDGFVKSGNFDCGRRADPLNEPVLQTLHSLLLNFGGIQKRLRSLNLKLESLRSKPTTDLQFLL